MIKYIITGISIIFIFYLSYNKENFIDYEQDNEIRPLSQILETVKTHGIKDKLLESKKVGTNPEWLKKDIQQLNTYLEEYVDNKRSLTKSEVLLIIETLGFAGKDALSSSSVIMNVILSDQNPDVLKYGLISLARINPDPSSILEFQDKLKSIFLSENKNYVEIFLSRNKSCKDLNYNIENELSKINFDKFITDNKMDISIVDNELNENLYKASLLGCLSNKISEKFLNYLSDTFSSGLVVKLIDTLSDQSFFENQEFQKVLINKLSDLMQFSSNYIVRERAFMALRRISNDQSLNIIRSYGHKMLKGDTKKLPVNDNPFISWAINHFNKEM